MRACVCVAIVCARVLRRLILTSRLLRPSARDTAVTTVRNASFLLLLLQRCSQMDARDFVEVVSCRLGDLFNAILEDPDLLHVVAHLLAQPPNNQLQVRPTCVASVVLLAGSAPKQPVAGAPYMCCLRCFASQKRFVQGFYIPSIFLLSGAGVLPL